MSKRALILGLLGLAGLAAWRYRIAQVGSFMIVAGLRRLVIPDPAPDFKALAPEWSTLEPTRTYPASHSRGMITYHPWYDHFQPAIANRCLAETAELGAGHIRIDVRWKDLMPDGRNVDEAAWNWYRHYLLAARNWYGLEPLIVLSNAPAPVLRYPVEARLAAWTRFVDALAQRAGHLCTTYQVLNEPNNPVFRIFPTQTTPLAIVEAAKVIRQRVPDAQITINILAGILGWQATLENLLRASGSAIDIVGLDYYPGTWTVSSNSDAANWNQFVDFIAKNEATSGSPLYRRPLAILETGYATNVQYWRGEEQQVRYLRTLGDAMKQLDARVGPSGLRLVGIHELSDADSDAILDPEAHFGLLTSKILRRKPGFDAARQLFHALR